MMRKCTLLTVILAFSLSIVGRGVCAQYPPRFQPPKPPPIDPDQEFDDPGDDFEVGERSVPAVGQTPPPNTQGQLPPPPSPPVNDFRPVTPNPSDGKVRFKIVENAFYEKGKPRGRAPI